MTSSIASLLMILVLWLSIAIFCCADGASEKPLSAGERAEALRGKEQGCQTAEKLRAAGGFTKIEAGYSGVTHAYVTRAFYAVPVDAKEDALKAVALCHIDLEKRNQLGLVIIHDAYSGKRVGTFDFSSGLRME